MKLKEIRSESKYVQRWISVAVISSLMIFCIYSYSHSLKASNLEFSRQQQQFLKSTAQRLNYPLDEKTLSVRDIFQILGNLQLYYNKTQDFSKPKGYYKILSDVQSGTLDKRDIPFKQLLAPTLTAGSVLFVIKQPFNFYKYEITNIADHLVLAPILYQNYRWDSTEKLIESAGFREIADETDRAIALWKFLAENRYHFSPVTEETEEHDVIKYLSLYGYGFCDDSARVLTRLADKVGLKGRFWGLWGHVVPEIFADGKWRMLDPDYQVYFHKSGNPKDIYNVQELASNPSNFDYFISLTGTETIESVKEKYSTFFLTKEDNRLVEGDAYEHSTATTNYQINLLLRPTETIAFTNYNWGRYFMGGYPDRVPKYFNGYYRYLMSPNIIKSISENVRIEPTESGVKLLNPSSQPGNITLKHEYAFPIVGGAISGTILQQQGDVHLRLNDNDNALQKEYPLQRGHTTIDTSSFFSVMAPHPTFNYTVTLALEPGASIEIGKDFVVISDFQFADFALLKLHEGENQFQVYTGNTEKLNQFQFKVYLQ